MNVIEIGKLPHLFPPRLPAKRECNDDIASI